MSVYLILTPGIEEAQKIVDEQLREEIKSGKKYNCDFVIFPYPKIKVELK